MDVEGLIAKVREHYLDQFRAFVEQQRESCSQGCPELKLRLGERAGLYRNLYCVDFIAKEDDGPKVFELAPARYLAFAPITCQVGSMEVELIGLRWDQVTITHDKPDLQQDFLHDWFDIWFDPSDARQDPSAELSDVIHFVAIDGLIVSADFGSAPIDAFWSLLDALEKAGCQRIRITEEAS